MTDSGGTSVLDTTLGRFQSVCTGACVAASVACAIGWMINAPQSHAAWLTAYFYWLGIAAGSLAFAMIHGMTGGAWGTLIRPTITACHQTMLLMLLLFVPIWIDAGRIYDWADPEYLSHHEAVIRKVGYLNLSGFRIRAVLYLLTWCVLSWKLTRLSNVPLSSINPAFRIHTQQVCGMAFIVYGFTMTLAAVDWMMSLEPDWYSTMYGLIHISGQGVSGLSFSIVLLAVLKDIPPWSSLISPSRLNDVGNMLLAAVMFWAYCMFFQYLVIWAGNLPEETEWYLRRNQHGWQYLILLLLALEFIAPFLLLLWRQRKRQVKDLGRIALLLLSMRYFEIDWLAVPGFSLAQPGPMLHWIDVAAFVAIGSAWLVVFCWRLPACLRMPSLSNDDTEPNHDHTQLATA